MRKILFFLLLLSGATFAQSDSGVVTWKGAGSRTYKLSFPNDSSQFLNGKGKWHSLSGGGSHDTTFGIGSKMYLSGSYKYASGVWLSPNANSNGIDVNFVSIADPTDTINYNYVYHAYKVGGSGTLRNLVIRNDAIAHYDAGAGDTITVWKNGSATSIKAIISGDNLFAYDTAHTLSVSDGDLIAYYQGIGNYSGNANTTLVSLEYDYNGVLLNDNFSGTSSGTNTGDQTLNSLLPDQTGHANDVLTTDGTGVASWQNVSDTVTLAPVMQWNINSTAGTYHRFLPLNLGYNLNYADASSTCDTVRGSTVTTFAGTLKNLSINWQRNSISGVLAGRDSFIVYKNCSPTPMIVWYDSTTFRNTRVSVDSIDVVSFNVGDNLSLYYTGISNTQNFESAVQVLPAIAHLSSLNDILPSQTSNAGKVLTTDGTTASWQNAVGVDTAAVYTFSVDGVAKTTLHNDEASVMQAGVNAGGSNTGTAQYGFVTVKDTGSANVGILLQNTKRSQNGSADAPGIRSLSNVTISGTDRKQVIWDLYSANFTAGATFYGTQFNAIASFADSNGTTGFAPSGGFWAEVAAEGSGLGVQNGTTFFRVGSVASNDNVIELIGTTKETHISPNSIYFGTGGGSLILSGTGNNNTTFTFPPTLGSVDQIIRTDGSGNMSWVNVVSASLGGAATPAAGKTYQDNQIIAWGNIAANGTITSQFGNFGIAHTGSSGVYTITLPTTPSFAVVTITPQTLALTSAVISGATLTVNTDLGTIAIPVATDEAFYFIITGRP